MYPALNYALRHSTCALSQRIPCVCCSLLSFPPLSPLEPSFTTQPFSFDLIFLDANKDGYQSYYNTIMDRQLLAPGGLLVVDNTLMKVR